MIIPTRLVFENGIGLVEHHGGYRNGATGFDDLLGPFPEESHRFDNLLVINAKYLVDFIADKRPG